VRALLDRPGVSPRNVAVSSVSDPSYVADEEKVTISVGNLTALEVGSAFAVVKRPNTKQLLISVCSRFFMTFFSQFQ
jgi:DNA-binding beta-propeller fold protein YncE